MASRRDRPKARVSPVYVAGLDTYAVHRLLDAPDGLAPGQLVEVWSDRRRQWIAGTVRPSSGRFHCSVVEVELRH